MEKPANSTGTWFSFAVIFCCFIKKDIRHTDVFFCAILRQFTYKMPAFLLWHFN